MAATRVRLANNVIDAARQVWKDNPDFTPEQVRDKVKELTTVEVDLKKIARLKNPPVVQKRAKRKTSNGANGSANGDLGHGLEVFAKAWKLIMLCGGKDRAVEAINSVSQAVEAD